jgi:hypothetical protein
VRMRALGSALLLGWASAASAQQPPAQEPPPNVSKETEGEAKPPETKPMPPAFTFALHGFVSGSVYFQDANLGPSEGQQSLFVNNQPAVATRQPNTDKLVFGGDVRQSRFNFSVAGPKVFSDAATPKAVLEIDFFGGFGSGNYGDVSLTPRLRWVYAELDFGGGNRLLAGQTNDLIFTMAPVSLAHIAFPYGYGAGNIGWRRPGLFGFHNFGDPKGSRFELAWEVGRSQWADSGALATNPATGNGIGQSTVGSGGDKYGFSLGEASGLPAVEARLTWSAGNAFTIFTTGHWQRIDRSGVDASPPAGPAGTTTNTDLDVVAVNAGAKIVAGPLTLAATGFTGKNLAPLVGDFLQFQANTVGDVHEMGGWVQAGLNFTKELSVWGFIGTDKPDQEDAIAAGYTKVQNVTTTGLLQYRDGGYAVGFELIHFYTKTRGGTRALDANLDGNQYMLTTNYFF